MQKKNRQINFSNRRQFKAFPQRRFGTKYSRMVQVKFLKAVLHKFYLFHYWIFCLNCSFIRIIFFRKICLRLFVPENFPSFFYESGLLEVMDNITWAASNQFRQVNKEVNKREKYLILSLYRVIYTVSLLSMYLRIFYIA